MRFSRITRQILREMVLWIAIGLAGAVFVFLVTQLARVAPILADAGTEPRRMAAALLLLTVPVCGWALTPAFALAAFATFGRMSRDGELLALDAAGAPRWGIAAGPLILLAAVTGLGALVWLEAAPRSQQRLRSLVVELAKGAVVHRIPAGAFVHPVEGTTFYADRRGNGAFEGVFFESTRVPDRSVQVAARSARLVPMPHRPSVALRLEDGTAFVETADRAMALTFGTLDLTLPLGDALEGRLDFLPSTMAEPTARLLGPPPPGSSPVRWRYSLWRRIAGPVGTVTFSLFALLLAAGTRWRSRGRAVTLAAGGFLAFHLLGRLGETLMVSGLPAPLAALLPSLTVVLISPALLLRRGRRAE